MKKLNDIKNIFFEYKKYKQVKGMIKISNKKLNKEKEKCHMHLENDQTKHIEQKIEEVRNKLNNRVIEDGLVESNKEILKLSQELDNLIIRYLSKD